MIKERVNVDMEILEELIEVRNTAREARGLAMANSDFQGVTKQNEMILAVMLLIAKARECVEGK